MQILIVEDEEKIANLLRKGLTEENYSVDIARDGEEAIIKQEINDYDVIILDLMIPKIMGDDVCREIRKKDTATPILILTAKDSINNKVSILDAGADDYVTKPFSFAELSARVRALIRRNKKADPTILTIDNLSLNPATRTAMRAGKQILLTAREYSLLEYLLRNQNIVLTKTQILEHVWDYNYEGFSNIVETYIKYLRKKLQVTGHEKKIIQTRRGSGYMCMVINENV